MEKKWLDASLPIDKRIDLLMQEMTLQELAGQLHQVKNIIDFSDEEISKGLIGSSLGASGPEAGNVKDKGMFAADINRVQRAAVEKTRLGIPLLMARDVIHGHRTVFPIPLGMSCAWNPALVEEAYKHISREARSCGIHWTFTPMLDIGRDPRWGRVAEGFGEDPWLTGEIGRHVVKGIQGNDISSIENMAACAKHYVAYGGAEAGRDYNTVDIGIRSLHDTYLPPFKAVVEEGVETIMSSFNEIDGVPSTGNRYVLREVLKEAWGFSGIVVSDWDAVAELISHGISADGKAAAALAINSGLDIDMIAFLFIEHLPVLVEEGLVSREHLEDSVRRVLSLKFRMKLFENPYVDEAYPETVMLTSLSTACAEELAAETMILLKNNDKILPLKNKTNIKCFGPMVDARAEMHGTWTLDGRGEDVETFFEIFRKECKKELGPEVKVRSCGGFIDQAQHMDHNPTDLYIACIGEHPLRSGEHNCLVDIGLPPGQLEMIQALHRKKVPVIAVVFAGRPLDLSWLDEHVDAIVYAWHPGTRGARALTDILLGRKNPSGKTTITFPRCTGQVPIYYNHKNTGRPEIRHVRKHYIDAISTPLYPFGYGLSYTSFAYSDLKVKSRSLKKDDTLSVNVKVTNSGDCDGREITQLYVRDLVGSVTRPVKELKAFEKVFLKAGETKELTLTVPVQNLAFTDINYKQTVEAGDFKVFVGTSSEDCLEEDFAVIDS
jgi:beta-glucosidase